MLPRDLLVTADDLLKSSNNKPRQSNLLRATSSIYYALFHTLAKCSADLLVGGDSAKRSAAAWQQVYRALEHKFSKNCCKAKDIDKFPSEIKDFAELFVTMQEKRHLADYDPYFRITKSEVLIDLGRARSSLDSFDKVPVKDRRAFSAFLLFKKRK